MAEDASPDNSRQNPGSTLRDYPSTCHQCQTHCAWSLGFEDFAITKHKVVVDRSLLLSSLKK